MAATRYLFTCLLAILLTDPSQAQWAIDDYGCTTPDRSSGVCQPIHSCKPIVDYITAAKKPLSHADRGLLLSYQCGFEKNTVKVCCPEKPIRGGDTGSPDTLDAISRHKNIKLIPIDNCGPYQSDDKILNGNITALFEFPWMALLRYNDNGRDAGFKCGGTLINKRYILTAAHCITNLKTKTLTTVRLGEYDIKMDKDCETHFEGDTLCADPVQDFTVDEIIPHSKYSIKTFENDIGLLRLNRDANISVDSVKPVCLPIAPAVRNTDLKKVIVTGWGRTENSFQSNVLLKVDLPIMAPQECQQRYSQPPIMATITDKQICAGGVNEKDSCGGDSGGPLQFVTQYNMEVRYVQYGIVSFGPNPCSTRGLPGVYTKITKYLDWILDNIKP